MYDIETENRFWSKIETGGEDECWKVVAFNLNHCGYGEFSVKSKIILAHRFSFQLFHNRLIKDKMCICHKCDNPSCVNPHHLFEGTIEDNNTDKMNKGRFKPNKGEDSGMSKLTEIIVKQIRDEYKKGGTTQRKLGDKYGLHFTNIGYIIRRETWKHLPP